MLSKEYVSDSSDDEREVGDTFQVPPNYKQCRHLKKFAAPSKGEKKEIWLLKVPKSLDISKLKKLPVDFSGAAPSELEADGRRYFLRQDLEQEDEQAQDPKSNKYTVLAPDGKNLLRAQPKARVVKFFNVSEAVRIPEINVENYRVPRQDVVKVIGLKTRHFATGYSEKDFEDVKEEDEPPKKKRKSSEKKDKKDKKKTRKSIA